MFCLQALRISSEQTKNCLISTEAAVQQGEVSSSKPTRLSNTQLAPLLLSVCSTCNVFEIFCLPLLNFFL